MRSYRSKMVERIRLPPRDERDVILERAGYNVFNIDAADVYIDLLTDSGTGTMSTEQWAALLTGDEAYAGSRSFKELQSAVSDVMGFDTIIPTHQGRGAENVLYGALLSPGDVVPNNTHFDTTRAHIVNNGATPVDCLSEAGRDIDADGEFKGNFSVERAREVVDDVGAENVPVVIVTITNNSTAGQPVSVQNIREARAFADEVDAMFVIDACRFAENAYFVTQREPEFSDASVAAVAREELSYADAIVMSGKKDGLSNIGGFVGVRDDDLAATLKQRAILYEGFPTYGGMAGRDIAAMAVGLREAVEKTYVEERVGQVAELGELLADRGVPIYRPTGGHAVYLDAEAFLPHIPAEEFPGQALVGELYREGGIRAVELGSFAFPSADDPLQLVRMCLPRRMYHKEHLEHIADAAAGVLDRREDVAGMRVVEEPEMKELRHFSATLEPVR